MRRVIGWCGWKISTLNWHRNPKHRPAWVWRIYFTVWHYADALRRWGYRAGSKYQIRQGGIMAKKGTLFGKPRGEVIKHPGAFSAKAAAAGKSTAQYATEKASAPGQLGKQARLAKAFATMRCKKK